MISAELSRYCPACCEIAWPLAAFSYSGGLLAVCGDIAHPTAAFHDTIATCYNIFLGFTS